MASRKYDEYYEHFVEKFIECNNKRRSVQWAREVTGKPPLKNAACEISESQRLFKRPVVQELLEKKRKTYLKKLGVTPEKTLAEIAKLAFARLPDLFQINGNGEATFDFNLMTPELEAAIGEYTVDTYMSGRGENAEPVKKVRVKLGSKLDALEKLMRYFGMYEKDNEQSTKSLVEAIRAGRERARDKRRDK